jgi:hypothetical protein
MRVVSRLSPGVNGGRMVGSRWASIVLPVPGDPIIRTLWTILPNTKTDEFAGWWPSAAREVETRRKGLDQSLTRIKKNTA